MSVFTLRLIDHRLGYEDHKVGATYLRITANRRQIKLSIECQVVEMMPVNGTSR
jgi:hypothetical protein